MYIFLTSKYFFIRTTKKLNKSFLGKYDLAKLNARNYIIGVGSEQRRKIILVAVFMAFFNSLITHSI